MTTQTLSQIEKNISYLSLSEQLWLMERLIQQVRKNTLSRQRDFERDLATMANDPQIQNELKIIEEEFSSSEMNGLENI